MKLSIVYLFIFHMVQFSYGTDENQSWTKLSVEKKLPYSLNLELSQGLRFKDHISTFNQAFFEVSLSYKDSNGFKINIPYRYTIFEDKIKHRLSFGSSYQYSFKPVILKYRIKFYRLYENGKLAGEDGETLGNLIRNKFTFKYKTGKNINPYISGELFHLFNTDNNSLDEYRASFGIEINLPRKNSINFFYIFKKEDLTKSSPDEINVFGVGYISKI